VPDTQKKIFLAEACWKQAQVGWEKPKAGMFPSENKFYLYSIYAHASSFYSYDIGGKWERLKGFCGLARGQPGSVIFVVRADGRELYRSNVIRDSFEVPFEVDIKGKETLELIVEPADNGKRCDHGIWFTPVLER
jgi:NPCBM/NEW2 domain